MSDKKRKPTFLSKIAFWKRGSSERWNRSSVNLRGNQRKPLPSFPAPKPPSIENREIKCKLTYSGQDDLNASGFYDKIDQSILYKRRFNDTFMCPIDYEDSFDLHSVNHQMPSNDEHDYLELVTEMDKASQETALDGMLGNKKETIPPILPPKSRALYDEEDIKREDALNKPERIQAIQEKQKVSLKTLYINVEASPDIPRRSPTVIRKSESIDIAAGEYESCDAFKQPISSEDQEEGQLMDGDNIGLSSNICPDVIVCIRGVPDSISKAKMSEYLEKKMSISEDFFKVIPGENGLVIVEFFKKIELGPLGIALKNEHEKLDFCVVNTPKSVIVSSSELILDVNELKNYFGNYKNLGKLSHITEMDYGMMDIEFDTEEAVYTICANLTHSITEKQVHVSPLYECRFGKVWHKEWHKQIILPTDIHLEKIDPMLASFIQSSNSAVSIFDRKLLHSNAKLSLGKNKNDISIECLLKPYSQGVNVKAKTWRKTAIETWEKSVNELISKKEIHVPEEHIKRIKKYRRQYEEKGIEEILVEFHENPHDFWIEIIGLAEKVKKVYECYLNVIKTCTQHIQLPFSQIERIQQEGLLHYLESKNNVVIENDFRQRQILIRGVQEDVVNSKQEIFSILQNRTTDTVFAYQKSTDKLSQEANSQDIVNKIQENTEEQNTYEHINPLEDEPTYDEIVQGDSKMTCRHGTTINIVLGELGKQKADVLVCSTNSDLKLGISSVGRNLLQNGGDDLQLECDQKYPTGIASGDIAKINGGSLDCKCIYLGILRNWNEGQYQYAKTVLSEFVYNCLKKASESKRGLTSVTFPALGAGALKYPIESVAEMMFKGVLDFDAEAIKCLDVSFVIFHKDQTTFDAFENQRRKLTTTFFYITPKRHINVIIEPISLLEKKVDVMVCNAPKNLEFVWGALLKAIRRQGGDDMENDCRTKYPKGIQANELAVVNPGGLSCSQIYFGYLPFYKTDPKYAEKALSKLIYDSLDMASNCGKSTIAFPPMGTGILEYPHQKSARIMYNAVKEFDKKTKLSVMKEVYFTILPTDLKAFDAFCAENTAQS